MLQNFLGYCVLFLIYIGIVLLIALFSKRTTGKITYFLLITFVLTIIGSVIYVTLGPFRTFADADYYHNGGLNILHWWKGIGSFPYSQDLWLSLMDKRAWPTGIALIYLLAGVTPFFVVQFNIILIGATSVVIAATIKTIDPTFTPKWLFSLLFLITPFLTVFGVTMGREAIYWFATSVMVYATSKFIQGKLLAGFLLFLISGLVLVIFRPNLGIPQIYVFIIPIFVYWTISYFKFEFKRVLLIAGIGLLIFASIFPAKALVTTNAPPIDVIRQSLSSGANSGFSQQPSIPIDEFPSLNSEPESGKTVANSTSDAGGSNSLSDYVTNALLSYPRALLGPFPSEFSTSPVMLLSEVNLLYWIVVLLLAVVGILQNRNRKEGLLFLCISLFCIASFSALLTNYGILTRFRSVSVIVLMPYSFYVLTQLLKSFRLRNLNIFKSQDGH